MFSDTQISICDSAKAVDMNDFSKFLLWLTDQDAVLAGIVATKQEEFLAVFEKVRA